MEEGTIYILINGAMPGYVKLGRTSSDVEQRMKEIDTTGVPIPFECFHASKVNNSQNVEKLLHDAFGDHRVRKRREFFQNDPERIRSALLLVENEDVTPRNDVTETEDDYRAINNNREIRSAFNFSRVDIQPGSKLHFTKDQNYDATVIDDKRIEFEGQVLSLSAAALIIINRMGYTWKQIAGPSYWEYDGETLSARRLRYEQTANEVN